MDSDTRKKLHNLKKTADDALSQIDVISRLRVDMSNIKRQIEEILSEQKEEAPHPESGKEVRKISSEFVKEARKISSEFEALKVPETKDI